MVKKNIVFIGQNPVAPNFNTKIEKLPFEYGLINYGRRIIVNEPLSSAGEVATLYTVPLGKTFYLIGAILAGENTGATSASCFARVAGTNILQLIIRTARDNASSIPFTIPIKLTSGETLIGESEVGISGFVGFTGYEVDSAVLPLFT